MSERSERGPSGPAAGRERTTSERSERGPSGPAAEQPDEAGRRLFRYVVGDEWREYRAVIGAFAGTFFAELTPDDVAARVAAAGVPLDPAVVGDRLESLRRWGNLTVSSAVGSPTSLADYYRRRNRYLITRAGQEVHDVVEGVLTRVDEVRDVSTGRLRSLLDALDHLAGEDLALVDPVRLADLVGAVFDPHEAFTSEITQFFAAINQWQSRYDLSPEEFTFFAEVLVGYVAERLDEIERTARPIGRRLDALASSVPTIVERANRGLAARVERAGLQDSVQITRRAGSRSDDWVHLAAWFVSTPGRPSRIEQLSREAVAAIRTLTLNLTRLSRVGVGASSRRADFLRLARWFSAAGPDDAARLAVAALGLHPTNHFGVPAADADDPVSTATLWRDAPRAPVPLSLRERGDTTNRGRPSPIPDRSSAQRVLRRRREQQLEARRRDDVELLDEPELDGRELTSAALARLQEVLGRTLHELGTTARAGRRADGSIVCVVERTPGRDTVVSSPEGRLTVRDLRVRVVPDPAAPAERVPDALAAAGGDRGR
ncbi:MAG: TIGR02677 family protein [Acidimicrobiales bacterium]